MSELEHTAMLMLPTCWNELLCSFYAIPHKFEESRWSSQFLSKENAKIYGPCKLENPDGGRGKKKKYVPSFSFQKISHIRL